LSLLPAFRQVSRQEYSSPPITTVRAECYTAVGERAGNQIDRLANTPLRFTCHKAVGAKASLDQIASVLLQPPEGEPGAQKEINAHGPLLRMVSLLARPLQRTAGAATMAD
jgi:hypothetical protein